MIATQGSVSRDVFARTLESARRKLRETIEKYPDPLTVGAQPLWRRGFFPGMLWIVQSQPDPDVSWWRDQAIRYSQPLAGMDGEGLGFALVPSVCRWAEVTGDPVARSAVLQAAHRLEPRLEEQEPSISSLMDSVVLWHSGDPDLRAAASAHALSARRLLVRGDGSLAGDSNSACDLALAIDVFGAAYRFTRDVRFLGVAENCAACFLETSPSDTTAEAIAASALLQLSSLTADSAKARLYAIAARQFLRSMEDGEQTEPEARYYYLNAVSQSAGLTWVQPANEVLDEVLPSAPEPEPEPQPEPEPATAAEEPQGRFLRPLTFLLAPLIFYLLVDVVIFRSNFYTRFLEPESSAGTFEGKFEHEMARAPGPRQILVLGSSRIEEGFSAKRANLLEPKGGYYFINGAVSGAGPRCMYYLLRDLDPHRNRYQAIVMTIDDYTDPDDYEDLADRVEDLNSVAARLRLSDVIPFMRSFTTRKTRWHVLAGSLLKSLAYQRDLQEFLDHPSDRLDKATLYRGHRFDWSYDYGGSDHTLAGTTIDWNTQTISFPPNMPKSEQDYLRPRLMITAPQKDAHVRKFQVRWLGAIADLYRNSKTRLIFIQAPRTPLPRPVSLAHWDWTTVDNLARRPWVTIVDVHTFENLERPELFSDYAHLNSEGQKQFSPALAATVKSILEAKTQVQN